MCWCIIRPSMIENERPKHRPSLNDWHVSVTHRASCRPPYKTSHVVSQAETCTWISLPARHCSVSCSTIKRISLPKTGLFSLWICVCVCVLCTAFDSEESRHSKSLKGLSPWLRKQKMTASVVPSAMCLKGSMQVRHPLRDTHNDIKHTHPRTYQQDHISFGYFYPKDKTKVYFYC